MEKLVHKRRLLVFAVLIIMAMAGLGVRLVILQYVELEKYWLLAQKIRKRTFLRQPRRGDMLDRNGNLLAKVGLPSQGSG